MRSNSKLFKSNSKSWDVILQSMFWFKISRSDMLSSRSNEIFSKCIIYSKKQNFSRKKSPVLAVEIKYFYLVSNCCPSVLHKTENWTKLLTISVCSKLIFIPSHIDSWWRSPDNVYFTRITSQSIAAVQPLESRALFDHQRLM